MKNILSVVRGWVVVGVVLGSGVAWGQAGEITLTAKNGCKLIHTVYSPLLKAIQLRNVSAASKCSNGYFEGAILYGYEVTFAQKGQRLDNKILGIQASILQGGRSKGFLIRFDKSGTAYLNGGPNNWVFDKKESIYNFQKTLDLIQEDGPKSNDPNYAVNVTFLSEVLKIWDADPDKFMQENTSDTSGPTIAYSFKPITPPVQLQRTDDPKVFGRSARGG